MALKQGSSMRPRNDRPRHRDRMDAPPRHQGRDLESDARLLDRLARLHPLLRGEERMAQELQPENAAVSRPHATRERPSGLDRRAAPRPGGHAPEAARLARAAYRIRELDVRPLPRERARRMDRSRFRDHGALPAAHLHRAHETRKKGCTNISMK